jgi:hypothetical protein
MAKTKRLPKIETLTKTFPFPIKNLELINLRLANDTILSVAIEEQPSGEVTSGLSFINPSKSKTILFEDTVELTKLPPTSITTSVMAEATAPWLCLNLSMKELAEHVFAAAISLCGEVVLEMDISGDPELDDRCMVELSITAGTFAVSTKVLFSSLSSFLEKDEKGDENMDEAMQNQ